MYAISPKLYKSYNEKYKIIKTAQFNTYLIIGVEGYRTIAMYKNKNGIYCFTVYIQELESCIQLE